MKRILSVFVVIIAVFSLASCGSDNGSSNASDAQSTASTMSEITEYTIGNTTAKELSGKISALQYPDGFTCELKDDGLGNEYASAGYIVRSSDGKEMSVNISSDLENKAANVMMSWNYKECSADVNTSFVEISKSIVIASWPDYSKEAMNVVEKMCKFTPEHFKAISNQNISKTSNAVSGYIAIGMSSGKAYVTICYPNLVENV